MLIKDLTASQLNDLSIVERTCSVLSLIGIAFIVTTFLLSKGFHKPINRLIFYASVGNLGTNVGTIISRAAIDGASITHPHLCQFQAFLIQMFLPADALWTFAMALNVYLTFYHHYDGPRLRRLEKWYIAFCYGLPLIPAVLFLFITTPGKPHIFGNATLWCWISSSYDKLRLWAFYIPVWVVCFATMFIYTRLFSTIIFGRNELRNASQPSPLISGVRTTDISFTSEPFVGRSNSIPLTSPALGRYSRQAPPPKAYNCEITSGDVETQTLTTSHSRMSTTEKTPPRFTTTEVPQTPLPAAPQPPIVHHSNTRRSIATLSAYGRVAFLFFGIMLLTWIPSSANRLYSAIKPGEVSIALEFMAAFVLPLQGFWNATIYILTSWRATKELYQNIFYNWRNFGVFSIHSISDNIKAAFAAVDEPEGEDGDSSRFPAAPLGQRAKHGGGDEDDDTESTVGLRSSGVTSRPATGNHQAAAAASNSTLIMNQEHDTSVLTASSSRSHARCDYENERPVVKSAF